MLAGAALLERFDRALREHEALVTQQVVQVDALGRKKLERREIPRAHAQLLVVLGVHDDGALADLQLAEDLGQLLGLDLHQLEVVHDEQTPLVELQAEGTAQRAEAHLARRTVAVVAGLGAMRLTTADHGGGALRTVTSTTRTPFGGRSWSSTRQPRSDPWCWRNPSGETRAAP